MEGDRCRRNRASSALLPRHAGRSRSATRRCSPGHRRLRGSADGRPALHSGRRCQRSQPKRRNRWLRSNWTSGSTPFRPMAMPDDRRSHHALRAVRRAGGDRGGDRRRPGPPGTGRRGRHDGGADARDRRRRTAVWWHPGEAELFITPGYRFRVVDAMLTNFHAPGTTLIVLVAAATRPALARGLHHGARPRISLPVLRRRHADHRESAERIHMTTRSGGNRTPARPRPHVGRCTRRTARGHPGFMPVGTRGTVKAVDVADLEAVGRQIVLANTYHLMLRPGAGRRRPPSVSCTGFMGWNGPILTDSRRLPGLLARRRESPRKVWCFASTYDGSSVELTPERAVARPGDSWVRTSPWSSTSWSASRPRGGIEAAMERTLRWSRRAVEAKRRDDRALFGIVQGGVDPELRGGLPRAPRPRLPRLRHRWTVGGGVGDRTGTLAIEAVVTELAVRTGPLRHGTRRHRGNPRGRRTRLRPLRLCSADPPGAARQGAHPQRRLLASSAAEWAQRLEAARCRSADASRAARYSRGYLRHLLMTKELLGRGCSPSTTSATPSNDGGNTARPSAPAPSSGLRPRPATGAAAEAREDARLSR